MNKLDREIIYCTSLINDVLSNRERRFYAYRNRGYAYLYKKYHKAAIDDFTNAIEISNIKKGCTSLNITRKIIFKTTAKIFLYRGIARIIIKDFDQGINDFNKGLNLDPKVIEQNEFELDVLSQETLGMIRSFFNI